MKLMDNVILLGTAIVCGCTCKPASENEPLIDLDGDGFSEADGDCDDHNPNYHPDAIDEDVDGQDKDCDNVDGRNVDGDSYADIAMGGSDCDDNNPDIHPDALDNNVDGIDQNCDGFDGVDGDGDLYADQTGGGDDCDDSDATVNPEGTELANDEIDQDCDGQDDTSLDNDMDGIGSAFDCDDTNPNIYPGALETPNDDIDQDCDGLDANYVGVGRYVFQETLPSNEYHCDMYFNVTGFYSNITCENCEYVFDLTISYDHESSSFQPFGTQTIAADCLDRMSVTNFTYAYTSNFELDEFTAESYGINVIQNAVLLYDPFGMWSNATPNEEGFVTMAVNGVEHWESNANVVSMSPDRIGFSYGRYHDEQAGSNDQFYSTDWIYQMGTTY